MHKYRVWFLAAAVYNLVWGTVNVIWPHAIFRLIGAQAPQPIAFWQVVGMMVLVYALGYYWAWRDPVAFRHYILIGFLGKLFGPIGLLISLNSGILPLEFGWIILTNDLIWLPAFALFLLAAAKQFGWANLLSGRLS